MTNSFRSVRNSRLQDWARSLRSAQIVGVALFAFLLSLVRGSSNVLIGDAHMYLAGAQALVSGRGVFEAGGMELRGALTPLVYAPSALFAKLFGQDTIYIAILIQNSIVIALLGVVLIPAVSHLILPRQPWWPWASGVVVASLLSGFAPFALMDVYAIIFVLLGILLGSRSSWFSILAGGAFLGAAINLRPAYLVIAIAALCVLAIVRWRSVPLTLLGVFMALVPQIATNLRGLGLIALWPANTEAITRIQAQYASFTVRYDTVPGAQLDARQFYCSPQHASTVQQAIPSGSVELALSFVSNPLESIPFMAQKVSSSLMWSTSTPYGKPGESFDGFAIAVLLVSAMGLVGLVMSLVHPPKGIGRQYLWLIAAGWLGALLTLPFSAPETRFAVPLLVFGIIGCLVGFAKHPGLKTQIPWKWGMAGVLLAVSLGAIGVAGVDNPSPPGDLTVADCATQ